MTLKMAKSKFTTKYTTAVDEAGHAVAACSVGFGMKKRGIVLEELKGTAYIRGPGRRSRNAKLSEIYHQRNAVVSLAGPAAEYRVNEGLTHSDADVQTIACALRELLPRLSALPVPLRNTGLMRGLPTAMLMFKPLPARCASFFLASRTTSKEF